MTRRPIYIVRVAPGVTITGNPPNGTVGEAYSAQLGAVGGTAPYTFELLSKPSWASINGSTGEITGTPDADGDATFEVKVTDSLGATATREFTIGVAEPPPTTLASPKWVDNTTLFTLTESGRAATRSAVSNGDWHGSYSAGSGPGKRYAELEIIASSGDFFVGLVIAHQQTVQVTDNFQGVAYRTTGEIWVNGALHSSGHSTWTDGDIIGMAVDQGTGDVWFSKNGTWIEGDPVAGTGATYTYGAADTWMTAFLAKGAGDSVRALSATSYAPSGFEAWIEPLDPTSVFSSGEAGAYWSVRAASSVWQDTAATTAAGDGDPVGRIDDQSGNGNHLTQGTATNRPTFVNSGGEVYADFDGSDDYMTGDGIGSLISGTDVPHSYIYSLKINGATSTVKFAWSSSASTTPLDEMWRNNSTQIQPSQRRDDSGSLKNTPVGGVATSVHSVWSGIHSGQSLAFYQGGNKKGDLDRNLGQLTVDQFTVGATRRPGTPDKFMAIDFRALLIIDRELTEDERAGIEAWMAYDHKAVLER